MMTIKRTSAIIIAIAVEMAVVVIYTSMYIHTSKVITKKNRPSVYVPYMICIYEIYTYIFV